MTVTTVAVAHWPTLGVPTSDRGTCDHCRGSADGCEARRAARFGRCCRLCTHGPADDDGNRRPPWGMFHAPARKTGPGASRHAAQGVPAGRFRPHERRTDR